MYKVSVEGSNVIWNCHVNQLKVRAVILPTSNSTDSHSRTIPDNSSEPPVPVPPTLRCLTRIKKPRRPRSPSS